VNNDGSFAFACDTTAPSNSDYIVARWTPQSGFALIAREGVQAPDQPPGVGYGSNAGDVHILDNHDVAFGSGGLTGSGDDAVFVNSAIDDGFVLFQDFVTVPENQTADPPHPLWFPYSFRSDATAENYIYDGMLTNGHGVVVVNNVVVAEYGVPLPGGFPGFFHDPDEAGEHVSPYNGHYAFRAPADFDADGFRDGDVVVVDNAVVGATDQPIVPGSGEIYQSVFGDNPFFLNVVNSSGEYAIGASVTGGPSAGALVMNGDTVLLRTRDPVDLNGDGLANDDAFIYAIASLSDSAVLTNNGRLYFRARLSNAANMPIGEAFLWMPVPVRADPNCDGRIDFFDIDPFLMALFDEPGYAAAYPECWRITADINRDGLVNFFDIDPFIACLFGVCP
jgi:hypothetical protein